MPSVRRGFRLVDWLVGQATSGPVASAEARPAGRSAAGSRILLLDSGLAWQDRLFEGALLSGRDFTGAGGLGSSSTHGTINAALLVADGWYRGLLPEATLYFGRVMAPGAPIPAPVAAARAIRWGMAQGVDTIVIPLGSPRSHVELARVIREARSAGATIFAAVGRDPLRPAFPARLPEVVAVGAGNPSAGAGWSRSWVRGDDVPAADPGPTIVRGSSVATVIAAGLHVLEAGVVPPAPDGGEPAAQR